ncbi:MAG: hypothetical protein HPY83_17740 [Anaerolineae bacterium]|nr:hypothetical protein [Anaerolineae bacterium]
MTGSENRTRGLLLLLALSLLLASLTAPMPAVAAEPHLGGVLAAHPPVDPTAQAELHATLAAAAVPWKVVYVVGEVDGPDGPTTAAYVDDARTQSAQLRQMGMTVVEFYPPNNRWADIVAAAADARVLIYAGHGVGWGGDPMLVGGMRLRSDESVHPDQIRSQLRMAPPAVVLLNHVCYAAGTSTEDVNGTAYEEALRRVAEYSQPFLEAGLAGYYANWYYGFPSALLASLASGMTLGEAYEAYHDFSPATVQRLQHPRSAGDVLWLDYDDWPDWPGLQYDYAFAGDPALTLTETAAPSLVLSQQAVELYAVPGADAEVLRVRVATSDGSPAEWTAWVDGGSEGWLTLDSDPAQKQLLLTIEPPRQMGTYSAEVIVRAEEGPLAGQETRLPVRLIVQHLTLIPVLHR